MAFNFGEVLTRACFVGSAWTLTYLRLSAPPADIKPTIIEANA